MFLENNKHANIKLRQERNNYLYPQMTQIYADGKCQKTKEQVWSFCVTVMIKQIIL